MEILISVILVLVIPVAICRIASIALRRFAAGGVIISIASKLVWLFPLGILGQFIGNPHLTPFSFFALLIFLQHPVSIIFQSFYQIVGMIIPHIKHGKGLPSKETYEQKCNYILPFSGKWTVVNGGVNKELSHSWELPSQRYAYDFIILDDTGKSRDGDIGDANAYFCYGKDIIAPADGVVVGMYDGFRDSFIDGKNAYCDALNIAGNYITIKHNGNEYSVIAHILKGSITVKKGESVKQGDIIAKCGNSGNSSEPHIHFQLQDGKSFFLSAGLPIAFSGITAQEKENYNVLDTRPCNNNLEIAGDKTFIGRGLEVCNDI
ncbi:MAG: M23 family metallopeptidase [Defluviitaleaceae bacterium]|nr:M23 family metallopeptidase [Defluviitaleaceae bacterium]